MRASSSSFLTQHLLNMPYTRSAWMRYQARASFLRKCAPWRRALCTALCGARSHYARHRCPESLRPRMISFMIIMRSALWCRTVTSRNRKDKIQCYQAVRKHHGSGVIRSAGCAQSGSGRADVQYNTRYVKVSSTWYFCTGSRLLWRFRLRPMDQVLSISYACVAVQTVHVSRR